MVSSGIVLGLNVAAPVVLAVVVNGIIFARGWYGGADGRQDDTNELLPPGYAIAIIWTALFALLGYAHYRLFPSVASFAVLGIILYAVAYPFLTQGLADPARARILNTVTLILAGLVGAAALQRDPVAFAATAPLIAWASYVNVADAIACARCTGRPGIKRPRATD